MRDRRGYRCKFPQHINLPMDRETLERIDAWRRPECIDARTKAIRALIEIALEAEAQRKAENSASNGDTTA